MFFSEFDVDPGGKRYVLSGGTAPGDGDLGFMFPVIYDKERTSAIAEVLSIVKILYIISFVIVSLVIKYRSYSSMNSCARFRDTELTLMIV